MTKENVTGQPAPGTRSLMTSLSAPVDCKQGSPMKCNGCSTPMSIERTEVSPTSRSRWYRCPLCSKVRLTCSPVSDTGEDPALVSQPAVAGSLYPMPETTEFSSPSALTTVTNSPRASLQLSADSHAEHHFELHPDERPLNYF